jgi:trimethylamine--corrinoid protein Co-methyltransferase
MAPGLRARRLTDAQCQRIFDACLEILERTGVRLYHPEALALMRRAGATITDENRVHIPPALVLAALKSAPKEVTLYNRLGEPVMPVGGVAAFFGPGSDCLHIIDPRDGQRRRARMQDVVDAMQVADGLDHIDFVMCMFLPGDVPQELADRCQMAAMLQHTIKPIVYVTTEFSGCLDAVAMAEAAAGGAESLRRKPLAACYVNVTTGLIHNQEALDKLLYLSAKGLPFAYVPSTQGGATAPVTPVAALAIAQAGALAGLVLSQLQNEGAPFILPGWGGNMLDMRTTVQPYADPDKRLLAADFAHFLGLPMFALAGCSEAKTLDQQAGAEAALTLFTDVLGGANIVHDLGYLESGLTGSLVQLALCDEILSWLDHFVCPPIVDDEALALDLIHATGPDGHYLESDHTFAHFRERWYPTLFERDSYDAWKAAGARNLAQRGAERVQALLEEHQPVSLPVGAVRDIEDIIRQRAAQLGIEEDALCWIS